MHELRESLGDSDRRFLVSMEQIASVVGPDFFASAAELLHVLLDVRFVFIAECTDFEARMARTLAFWNGAGPADNLDFCAKGGPCEQVIAGEIVHVAQNACERFPHNDALQSLAPDSYFGCPLMSSTGATIGHIAAMDTRPMDPSSEDLVILRILATRAAAELERRLIEDARTLDRIRISEERFRLAQEAADIGTWDMDVATGQGTWSDNYWEIYGLSPDSCVPGYATWMTLVHPDDRERVDSQIKAALEGDGHYKSEFRIVWPDGSVRWLIGKASVFRDNNGQPVRMLGVDYDVTELKDAERTLRNEIAERRHVETALREARDNLGTRVQERTSELREANGALQAEIAARKVTEELFQTVTAGTSAVTGTAFLRSLVRQLASALHTRYALVTEYNNETGRVTVLEMWTGDGFAPSGPLHISGAPCAQVIAGHAAVYPNGVRTLFPVNDTLARLEAESYLGVPLFDSTQQIIGHLAVLDTQVMDNPVQGLSVLKVFAARAGAELERKRTEERQASLELKLQQAQKLESLGVLAGGIAHDFNNLLVGVLGNAEIALLKLPPESPIQDELRQINAAALQAADLTKQMLAYSGKGKFEARVINLSELVAEIGHLIEVSIAKNVTLKFALSRNLPPIEADASQIRQVVMNLIINASEAMENTRGVVTVRTALVTADRSYLSDTYIDENLPAGDYVALEVIDTGCGMDEQTQKKIFDPFFTTKFTGRGLGLAALLGIVRGHGGAVKIDSGRDRGTAFSVLLPASRRPAVELDGKPVERANWHGSGTVLVVDDEKLVRDTSKMMIESLGFSVVAAENGRHAVEIFRGRDADIDVVLLDLTMPHMDGEETFRELRRIRPDVKVILSSGYTEQDITRRFANSGLAGFIQKPYRIQPIAEKIRVALDASPPSADSPSARRH